MKTLELNLPTPVLLVWGLPEESHSFVCGDKLMSYQVDKYYETNGKLSHYEQIDFPKGNWQLIGKLSELAEEDCKGLVRQCDWYHNYKEAVQTRRIMFDTALESFHSAIEALGQESKTLPANTLIFKKA